MITKCLVALSYLLVSVYQVLGFAIHLLGLKWFVRVYVAVT